MKLIEAKYYSEIDLTKYTPSTVGYENAYRMKKQGEQTLKYIKKISLLNRRNKDLKIAIKFLEGRLSDAISS